VVYPDFKQLKIFQDGALESDIQSAAGDPMIAGFTTNPTLMAAAGITDYEASARRLIEVANGKPISLEVFSDDFDEMFEQANSISSYGKNIFVKIPITNTKGESSVDLITSLTKSDVKLNVTAIFTQEQLLKAFQAIHSEVNCILSVFAGRIADTGIDPMPVMSECAATLEGQKYAELLWASPREVLNIYQAVETGCDIITATPDLIKKIGLYNKDLNEYSRETVQMFFDDAKEQKFSI